MTPITAKSSWTKSDLSGYSLLAPLNYDIKQIQNIIGLSQDPQVTAQSPPGQTTHCRKCGHPNVSKHTKFHHIISIINKSSTNDMKL